MKEELFEKASKIKEEIDEAYQKTGILRSQIVDLNELKDRLDELGDVYLRISSRRSGREYGPEYFRIFDKGDDKTLVRDIIDFIKERINKDAHEINADIESLTRQFEAL